jgi:hypothetical protein
MPFERREVSYNGTLYSRLLGTKLTSLEDIKELVPFFCNFGDYFFGGVVATESGLQEYFGQGPNHVIFGLMVQETARTKEFVYTAQIGIDSTGHIGNVLFAQDPGRNSEGVIIDASWEEVQQRRLQRILTLVRALPITFCYSQIHIGWISNRGIERKYEYLPDTGLLQPCQ